MVPFDLCIPELGVTGATTMANKKQSVYEEYMLWDKQREQAIFNILHHLGVDIQ